jgi:AmmeMemoRadiSam system protein A
VLTDDQRHALLALARASVLARVTGTVVTSASLQAFPRASGVFVTIKRSGELRGCLGTLECRLALEEEVARCAADSATHDPRFSPVTAIELGDLSFEVSVLGPLEQLQPVQASAITIGVHGLVIEHRRRRGVLLPQVAAERSWSAEQFLHQTCVKARLPHDAWQRGATVYVFAADVFHDGHR